MKRKPPIWCFTKRTARPDRRSPSPPRSPRSYLHGLSTVSLIYELLTHLAEAIVSVCSSAPVGAEWCVMRSASRSARSTTKPGVAPCCSGYKSHWKAKFETMKSLFLL
jgi:hypothetical protein